MKNFPIIHEGKEIWISRSVAVTAFVISLHKGEWYTLINKRGEGTPDFQGYYNFPCGYLDYDETTLEAAIREVREETGVDLKDTDYVFAGFSDDPKKEHQNVTFRYLFVDLNGDLTKQRLTNKYSEPNEVEDIKWVRVLNLDNYKLAFNHAETFRNVLIEFLLQVTSNESSN